MKIFLDSNVLVSVLNKEYPLFYNSARILSLADHPKFTLYTSPICLAIAFYFSEKKSGTQLAKKKIMLLSQKLSISTTDSKTVQQTTKNTMIHDFEDGLEYYSAIESGCKIIVTEDVSDFYYSEIPVYDCERFMDVVSKMI